MRHLGGESLPLFSLFFFVLVTETKTREQISHENVKVDVHLFSQINFISAFFFKSYAKMPTCSLIEVNIIVDAK